VQVSVDDPAVAHVHFFRELPAAGKRRQPDAPP
jgi:hypothetical protein